MALTRVGHSARILFRRMLQDLGNYLGVMEGIVLNEYEILKHLLWVDDLLLISDSIEGLQKQIDSVLISEKISQMIVNSLKTKVMIFGRSVCNPVFLFNHFKLDIVDEYKYLEVVFNSVSRSNVHIF